MLIVILKVTTKKQLKNYTKKEEENQNSTLQKIKNQIGSSEVIEEKKTENK